MNDFKIRAFPRRGFGQLELLTGVVLVGGLLLGVLLLVVDRGDGSESVPSYRMAYATYAYNALERERLAILSYLDTNGVLPGDDSRPRDISGKLVAGNEDGRIDDKAGESAKVFMDLHEAGLIPDENVRIRGRGLKLSWVRLLSGGKVLDEGNFFKLTGINKDEAKGFDMRFDDGGSASGNVLYFDDDDDGVSFYYRLELLK